MSPPATASSVLKQEIAGKTRCFALHASPSPSSRDVIRAFTQAPSSVSRQNPKPLMKRLAQPAAAWSRTRTHPQHAHLPTVSATSAVERACAVEEDEGLNALVGTHGRQSSFPSHSCDNSPLMLNAFLVSNRTGPVHDCKSLGNRITQ